MPRYSCRSGALSSAGPVRVPTTARNRTARWTWPNQARGRWHAADLPSGRVARRRANIRCEFHTEQRIPRRTRAMMTALSKDPSPTVSSRNAQLSRISECLNRSHDLSRRYIVVFERFVITLWMSRFDRLSLASSRTRTVVASTGPVMEPTASTIASGMSKRRKASLRLCPWPNGTPGLDPAIDAAVSGCLVDVDRLSIGKYEDAEANRTIDVPEPTSRKVACSGPTIGAGRANRGAVSRLTSAGVEVVHDADDPVRSRKDGHRPVDGGRTKRIEREVPFLAHA